MEFTRSLGRNCSFLQLAAIELTRLLGMFLNNFTRSTNNLSAFIKISRFKGSAKGKQKKFMLKIIIIIMRFFFQDTIEAISYGYSNCVRIIFNEQLCVYDVRLHLFDQDVNIKCWLTTKG